MNDIGLFSVVTTIQPPTSAVRGLVKALQPSQSLLIVVGDRKGPQDYPLENTEFLSLDSQLSLPFRLARLLPQNHYARKNLGYLVAIRRKAECIYETDDDNCPNGHFAERSLRIKAYPIRKPGWCNAYRYFTREKIWPRGFPLQYVAQSFRIHPKKTGRVQWVRSPIQQGLADGSPDVDACWRLLMEHSVRFTKGYSIALMPKVVCPFNSQSTWWWPEAFPLMYLPSFCSFRMTDIWRSLIAQRCLWEMGGVVTFHAPEVHQKRNLHNLFRDFEDEIPGYLNNDLIYNTLAELSLDAGPGSAHKNIRSCYIQLVKDGIFPEQELSLVGAWLADIHSE